MAQVLVLIIRCETKDNNNNIQQLEKIFKSPYFVTQVIDIETLNDYNVNTLPTHKHPDRDMEKFYMKKALDYSAEGPYVRNEFGTIESHYSWTNLPVLVIKDSSIALASHISDHIQKVMNAETTADLYFLSTWNDKCSKYTDVTDLSAVKWTQQPTSCQAVIYRPEARDRIRSRVDEFRQSFGELLNSQIQFKKLTAVAFIPNLIGFDINLATANSDYQKLNACTAVSSSDDESSNMTAYLWIIVLTVIIVFIAWALIQPNQPIVIIKQV